ncbi:hypothetical protein [Paenibacillus sp. DYY-L-2]|uniref:hypothetical protein n=1 Tax=Paenibacillus sp. DYY-L-2 TaxID=3447013 RepID=UPI003F4F6FE4
MTGAVSCDDELPKKDAGGAIGIDVAVSAVMMLNKSGTAEQMEGLERIPSIRWMRDIRSAAQALSEKCSPDGCSGVDPPVHRPGCADRVENSKVKS